MAAMLTKEVFVEDIRTNREQDKMIQWHQCPPAKEAFIADMRRTDQRQTKRTMAAGLASITLCPVL